MASKCCRTCQQSKPVDRFHNAKLDCRECKSAADKTKRAVNNWANRDTCNFLEDQVSLLPLDLQPEARAYMDKKPERDAERAIKKARESAEHSASKTRLYRAIRGGDADANQCFTEDQIRAFFTLNPPTDNVYDAALTIDQIVKRLVAKKQSLEKAKASYAGLDATKLARKKEQQKSSDKARLQRVKTAKATIACGEELTTKEELSGAKRIASRIAHMSRPPATPAPAVVAELAAKITSAAPDMPIEDAKRQVEAVFALPTNAQKHEAVRRLDPGRAAQDNKRSRGYEKKPKRRGQKKLRRAANPVPAGKLQEHREKRAEKIGELPLEEQKAISAKVAESTRTWRENKKEDEEEKESPDQMQVRRVNQILNNCNDMFHRKDPLNREINMFKETEASPHSLVEAITALLCAYCGGKEFMGIDRINSDLTYRLDNIAPCCHDCNMAKNCLAPEEYLQRCGNVANYACDECIDEDKCLYCGSENPTSPDRRTAGSEYTMELVDMVCVPCNYLKKNHTPEKFIEHCKRVAVHQRENPWDIAANRVLIAQCKDAVEANQRAINAAMSSKEQEKLQRNPYTIGRKAGDINVSSVSGMKIYHTPLAVTSKRCLEGEFVNSINTVNALDRLKMGHRPCLKCRKNVTPEEFKFLEESFCNKTGKIALKMENREKEKKHAKFVTYTVDQRAPTLVLVCNKDKKRDPYYHSENCKRVFQYENVSYSLKDVIFDAEYLIGLLPCWRCRTNVVASEVIPSQGLREKADKIRRANTKALSMSRMRN